MTDGCSRAARDARSTGYKLRFQSLAVGGTYDARTIRYTYDALARLLDAKTYPGQNTSLADANLLRRYQYAFDRSGNRTQQIVTVAGTPTTTDYSYNAANQLTSDGVHTLTYDNNGNLTGDGTNTYTWDRANRLLSMGGAAYGYDGAGNRVRQTVGANVTQYLLDVQPGLVVVLAETTGANTARYVHGPRGIHARKDAADAWHWEVPDGLGSVRMEADSSLAVEGSRGFAPYGDPFGTQGTFGTPYEFTGEPKDATNHLLYLRARYLNPTLGVFASFDPFEGKTCRPLSLNGYSWVEGNVLNAVDPSGELYELPNRWDACYLKQIGTPTPPDTPTPTLTATPTATPDPACMPYPISLASLLVQNAWSTSFANLSIITTGETVDGYLLPSGVQAVSVLRTYGVGVYVISKDCTEKLPGAAWYDASMNRVVLQEASVQPPNPPVYDEILVMHELTHAYLAHICPDLFKGETILNEMLAFYASMIAGSRDDFGVFAAFAAGMSPFNHADQETFKAMFPGTPYATASDEPSGYSANHASCGLPAITYPTPTPTSTPTSTPTPTP